MKIFLIACLSLAACTIEGLPLLGEGGDAGSMGGDGGEESEGEGDGGSGNDDGGGSDGGPTAEVCDEIDNDLDGLIDEGFDLDTDAQNCGECGFACVINDAFPFCDDGACHIATCADFCQDLNDNEADGCEYCCVPSGGLETCDGIDNNCDGAIDEGFDFENDTANCGLCGNECFFASAEATCEDSECVMGACDADRYDANDDPADGCEYECVVTSATEICDFIDNDCDGEIDEGTPLGGVCGTDVGQCSPGILVCLGGGASDCVGDTPPEDESCDGLDNDCDGVEDNDVPTGGECGTSAGVCEPGTLVCILGEYECLGGVAAGTETCDGLDNDCDGTDDDGLPTMGACGTETGACQTGVLTCTGGSYQCAGGVLPSPEICDDNDNDCDGETDEDIPTGGSCGTATGTCEPGTLVCVDGAYDCLGDVGPTTEICDGVDNDCDGATDEGLAVGGPCGIDTGACEPGVVTCTDGVFGCNAIGPAPEECDGEDNDCDGMTDEGFDFDTNPQTCGGCTPCNLAFAIEGCEDGECTVVACQYGHHNADDVDANGCEYACIPTGSEICDGDDNDCDGEVDADDPSMPDLAANPCLSEGECDGAEAECIDGEWICDYQDTVEQSADGVVASEETLCDSMDNDCDGGIDESYPIGDFCSDGGVGSCANTGFYDCDTETTVECVITTPATGPDPETCNNVDDDCDGVVDNDSQSLIHVARDGLDFWIFEFEASRTDADDTTAGSSAARACSKEDVLPWGMVTYAGAQDACAAVSMRLCSAIEWHAACSGRAAVTGDCSDCPRTYPYGDAYAGLSCNGDDYDTSGAAGDQDAAITTGSLATCGSFDGVSDMAGNLKEWTSDAVSDGSAPDPDGYRVRGGSYETESGGLTCSFNFAVVPPTFFHPALGFRCCCAPGETGCPPP